MSFITQIQASLQGCIIETPHSDDIRTICGTGMCPVQETNLLAGKEPWILQAGWADLGGGRFQFTNTGANNDVYKEINTRIKPGETYVMYYTIEALTAGAHAGRCAGNTSGTSTQATGTRRVPPFTAIVPGVDVTGVRAFPATDGFIVSDIRLYILADDPGS